ncbi:hypothetical protein [Chryseobacterium sp.]|uniref:hypothetical protein n=1 Tax=Chryseobacterium sp. TaxID=1871047 RepID=UPI002625E3DA|nr:hypothetical protein [Chryseobacterium sp.]
MKTKTIFLVLLLFLGNMILYAQCSVNAGGNATICGTSYTLQGSSSGSTGGTPSWTLVSKPSGAPDPVIGNVNSLTPNVTGMTSPGNYVFQVAQSCSPSGTVASQVTITAPGDVSAFTAGPDITNVNATTGAVTLNGVVPNGYTASWSAYNIYRWERSSIKTNQNSQFSSTTSATTTFSLINKANHDIDPAYVVTLRITSINNPNCWYEDTAIVRFIPNPQLLPTVSTSRCISSGASHYVALQSTSPKFSHAYAPTPGSSGNFGTTITMNVTSQPAGGNIAYSDIHDDNIYITGVNVVGTYKFTLTITNTSGTFTTPELTYTFTGLQSNTVNFLTSSRPEQMMIYNSGNSGGEVKCGYAGQSTPITFYYTIDPADNPATINTSVTLSGITPPGGAPAIVNGGAGTATRTATVTPPAGGWRVGTYRFTITRSNAGACSSTQTYYIHISDGARPNVTVPTTTVCYPGSGIVTATIPLPAVYKGIVNTSYFQDFDGRYRLTLVSKPAGAADPVFEPYTSILFTNTSTTISNLNMQGEYVFKIKADTYNPSVGMFLDKEYACSGTSLEGTFSVFVSAQVGANAGSAQTLIGTTQTAFNANNPGVAAGAWTLISKPAGAADPVIATPSAYNTNVTGLTSSGSYIFRWTVTTGSCSSTSDLTVSVTAPGPGGVSGADFWVKSDDAGTIGTAWKDNSVNADNIPNVGGITLSPADRAHNFNPYTTGYSASKFFYNTNSQLNSTNNYLDPSMRSSVSVFSAVRPTSANGTGRITGIDDDTNASEPGISINSGMPHIYKYFGNGGAQANSNTMSAANAFTTNKSSVFSAIQDQALNSGRGERRLGLDGIYETFNLGSTTNTFNVLGKHLRIGYAGWDSPGAFPGDIMEVMWYKRALTANEQSRVNSYLAVKNGTTLSENYLSTTSAVVWDITNNNGYNNNIFGIAKDNLTVLHQKQSGSVNDGQNLVISTTGFADTNAANGTGIDNDLQYLMTGDNGLKQNLMIPLGYTSGSNGTTNYRFESIWKVQNTNTVGTVTVAWPKGVKNLYLVQSSDAVFDVTDIFTPMTAEVTVNGVVYNTANVTLGNGEFFTFAGFGNAPGGVVNNLTYWYRADKNAANTGDGTDITAWTDLFSGTTSAQLGTNALPKYKVGASNYFNFNPGVNFTANTQTIGNTSVRTLNNNSYDIFILTKEGLSNPGSNARIFSSLLDNSKLTGGINYWDGFGDNYDDRSERMNAGQNYRYLANPGGARSTTIPSIVYHNLFNTTTGKGINGNIVSMSGVHTAIGFLNGGHAFGSTQYTIGGAANGSDNGGFVGNLGETIVYGNGNLTTTERRKVESYLAIKYGITMGRVNTDHYLDADGNMVWNGGTNTAYNNNVFGVAREDIGLFEQKVSKSVNAGTILTVATINDFVNPNNTSSRTSLANDKTYFLLGDNNLTSTTLSSITVNGYTGGSRISRIWLAQRTNTSGTMYFGADLSSYGGGFGSGDQVKMIIADDAAFTTNVVSVAGTYDVVTGKWVHSYNFDSGNTNRYITYAAVNEVSCTTGCNDNTYLNATDPNTIEYDNIIADETTTIVKQKDGSYYIWGPNTSPNVSTANTNVVLNLLTPTKIDPGTTLPTAGSTGAGFNYTGTPLKAALANVMLLLTTDGLYVWGNSSMGTGTGTYKTPNNFTLGKQTVNNKADGLPPGVSPTNVKMMIGNQETIALVTCSGAAWIYNPGTVGSVYGDNMAVNTANGLIWHRVMTSATQTLDNVVAVRGIRSTKFALTSDGRLYTWGLNTFHNDNTAGVTSNYATEISVPAGVTPKMIGMTEGNTEGQSSYYFLATNGKLYAMGNNTQRQLGLGDNAMRLNWTEVTATSGSNTLGGNIAWISPADNVNNLPSINVLTTDGKQWGWGRSSQGHLGVVDQLGINPTYMPGNGTGANELNPNDKVIAIKDGGQHAINFKMNSTKFGFIGLNSYGSKGDGTSVAGTQDLKYTYIAILDLCAKTSASLCYKPGIMTGAVLDTKVGITALGRAGAGSDNWPMVRKGGWIALEAKTKGFVPNRVAFDASGNPAGIPAVNFVEGMMVYDTTNKCMKMYTVKEGDAFMAWHCISTQTCPD